MKIGDTVKRKKDNAVLGTVVAVYRSASGENMLVVEGFTGTAHCLPESQLALDAVYQLTVYNSSCILVNNQGTIKGYNTRNIEASFSEFLQSL